MNDWRGVPIKVGSTIVYPSSLWVHQAQVLAIVRKLKAWGDKNNPDDYIEALSVSVQKSSLPWSAQKFPYLAELTATNRVTVVDVGLRERVAEDLAILKCPKGGHHESFGDPPEFDTCHKCGEYMRDLRAAAKALGLSL